MGKSAQQWQDRDYVLKQFGRTEGRAKKEYRSFVEAGSGQGEETGIGGRRFDSVGWRLVAGDINEETKRSLSLGWKDIWRRQLC